MKILHICASWRENNGAANIARMIAGEQKAAGGQVIRATWASPSVIRAADEVWLHCSWLPCLWWAALWARRFVWMPEASYDPVRLAYSGWKKRLVSPIERFFLRRADCVVATCAAEAEWIRTFEPRVKRIEITDIKRFFDLSHKTDDKRQRTKGSSLLILYLGRRHPLKGLQYLEEVVRSAECVVRSAANNSKLETLNFELKIVSSAFGAEKEAAFDWCDVLVLPTLSENFGLVVAEALEHGKRVITTDGAPAWGDGNDYDGRLVYLRGFRNGSDAERVSLLRDAICSLVACKP
ncbi:MAG: glycosyltransferase [Kiritimatiellae bacterium]|nr:glycosyltransferase [Kiritimatiellia bacterium]